MDSGIEQINFPEIPDDIYKRAETYSMFWNQEDGDVRVILFDANEIPIATYSFEEDYQAEVFIEELFDVSSDEEVELETNEAIIEALVVINTKLLAG
jgi:hypothetical protein